MSLKSCTAAFVLSLSLLPNQAICQDKDVEGVSSESKTILTTDGRVPWPSPPVGPHWLPRYIEEVVQQMRIQIE